MANRKRIETEDEKKVSKFQSAIHALVISDEFLAYTKDHDFDLLSRSAVAYVLQTGRLTIKKNVTLLAYAFLIGFMFGKKTNEIELAASAEKTDDAQEPTPS